MPVFASQKMNSFQVYLQPTRFIDSDSPEVIEFAKSTVESAETDINKVIRLYYSVRDEIRYDPYHISFDPEALKASSLFQKF
jgi:transglutaminase-like putative cysteine protease